ncbi:MAG: lysostaphin resistance A-like protein [Pleurocapsa sp.]
MTSQTPFIKITARSIIVWLILGSTVLTVIFKFIGLSLKSVLVTNNFNLEKINFQDPVFNILATNSTFYIITVSLLAFHIKKSGLQLNFLFGKLPRSNSWFRWLFMLIPVLIFSLGSGQIIYYLISLFDPLLVASLMEKKLFLSAKETSFPVVYNLIQLISIIIIAPIIEEILFRGILLQRWSVKWGILPAIITSSLLFGCLHFNVLGLINFGLVTALLYLRTKTLFLPIIFHALNNSIAVIMEITSAIFKERETIYTLEQIQSFWWQGLIAIAIALPCLILFWQDSWRLMPQSLPYFTNRDRACASRQPRSQN